jgi:hypothetical protein
MQFSIKMGCSRSFKLCMKYVCFKSTISNMATVQNFEVTFDKFTIQNPVSSNIHSYDHQRMYLAW